MKKFLFLLILAAMGLLYLFSCKIEHVDLSKTSNVNDSDTIVIDEKFYLTWLNYIYINPEIYLGKTIIVEGMYISEEYQNKIHHFVYRIGPGCCGMDGNLAGYEIMFDAKCPMKDQWIKVEGVLSSYLEDEETFYYLKLKSLSIMDKPGKKNVYH